jgi:hypothetical protein
MCYDKSDRFIFSKTKEQYCDCEKIFNLFPTGKNVLNVTRSELGICMSIELPPEQFSGFSFYVSGMPVSLYSRYAPCYRGSSKLESKSNIKDFIGKALLIYTKLSS